MWRCSDHNCSSSNDLSVACVLLYQEAEQQNTSLENLEFQKLEGEMNHAGKEGRNQELLKEIAEYQCLAVTRKVRIIRACRNNVQS